MILIVDDHHEVSAALRRLLSSEGYDVSVVDCGTDALAWLKHNRPRLVLLDHMMPDLSGVEVAQQAVQDRLVEPARVVFYTAVPGAVTGTVKALGLGGCISKGTEWAEMSVLVAEQILRTGPMIEPDLQSPGRGASGG